MRCHECRGEGFVNKQPKKIIRRHICEITEIETTEIIKVGGVDICATCQRKSEAEYLTQLRINNV
tara:strand:+ start:971 stop:1165 length:195 start_codon:yes stop_codon:yes gene_type:complete